MSVDLPAPFSPTMPWIVPRGTVRSTSLLAWTGPKRLLMPISSTAGVPDVGRGSRSRLRSRVGRGYLRRRARQVYWVE